MAKPKANTKPAKSGNGSNDVSGGKGGGSEPESYELTLERRAEVQAEALALGNQLLTFPGLLKQRVRWSQRISVAAMRDADELVLTPFSDEPPLTHAEIAGQRDRIELMRIAESEYQAGRLGQAAASKEFAKLAVTVGADRDLLLRAFDLRFRNDSRGQKRVSAIRAGDGDADLVQDASDVLALAAEEAAYVALCPRGEAAAVERLRKASPELSRLLGAKTLTEATSKARRLRDAAYTLVMLSERRIRAAGDYWYADTDKAREYLAFPTSGGGPVEEPVEGGEGPPGGGEGGPSGPA